MDLRIMTFNLRIDVEVDKHLSYGHRLPYINHFLSRLQLDVLATQEGTMSMLERLKMDDYTLVAKEREAHGETTGIFVHHNITILGHDFFWLSDTPEVESKHEKAGCKRIITRVKLQKEGQVFHVVNIHLDHVSFEARKEGINILMDRILPYMDEPVILLGDFNAVIQEPVHTDLSPIGFHHGFSKTQLARATFHGFSNTPFGSPIDFIYGNAFIAFSTSQIIWPSDYPLFLSDHCPVLATIKIKKRQN